MKIVRSQNGFLMLPIIIIVAVVFVVGFVAWRVNNLRNQVARQNQPTESTGPTTTAPKVPGSASTSPSSNATGGGTSGSTATGGNTTTSGGTTTTVTGSTTTTPPPPPPPPPPKPTTYTVSFNGNGFVSSSITIRAGDTVRFVNNSSSYMQPASNPHPSHTNYSGFDSQNAIAPGGSWSFTFNNKGTWGYHNHIKPGTTGTIVVQ